MRRSQHFGEAPSSDHAAGARCKYQFPMGSIVAGLVVARAPFGAWVDIGGGFPALLEVPNIAGTQQRRLGIKDDPAAGSEVVARVIWFRDDRFSVLLSRRAAEVKPVVVANPGRVCSIGLRGAVRAESDLPG